MPLSLTFHPSLATYISSVCTSFVFRIVQLSPCLIASVLLHRHAVFHRSPHSRVGCTLLSSVYPCWLTVRALTTQFRQTRFQTAFNMFSIYCLAAQACAKSYNSRFSCHVFLIVNAPFSKVLGLAMPAGPVYVFLLNFCIILCIYLLTVSNCCLIYLFTQNVPEVFALSLSY